MLKCAKRSGKPGQWFGAVCSVCIGLLCLLLAVYATVLYCNFTPVYRTIRCGFVGSTVQDISVGSIIGAISGLLPPDWLPGLSGSPPDLSFSIVVQMQCQNPNPYEFSIASKEAGGIYVGADRVRVGSMATLPPSSMPAAGTGTLYSKTSVKLNGKDTPQLISELLRDLVSGTDIPIWMEPNEEVEIKVPLLFQSAMTTQWSRKCGMSFANPTKLLLNPNSPTHSVLACADSFDELKIPPSSEGKSDEGIYLEAVNIDPSQVQQGENLKNAALIPMMAVFYLLGVIFFWLGYRRFFVAAKKDLPPAASAAPSAPPLEAGSARNVDASSHVEAPMSV